MEAATPAMALESFRQLNRSTISDPNDVRALFEKAQHRRAPLGGGIDARINQRVAFVDEVGPNWLRLKGDHLSPEKLPQANFHFVLDGSRYFFAGDVIDREGGGSDRSLLLRIPAALHIVEQRSLPRTRAAGSVLVRSTISSKSIQASLVDASYEGLAIDVPRESAPHLGARLLIEEEDQHLHRGKRFGLVRNIRARGDLVRLGLSVSQVPFGSPIRVERREHLGGEDLFGRTKTGLRMFAASVGATAGRLRRALGVDTSGEVEVLRYENNLGQPMVAIVDRVGDCARGTCIVIPPAWGRTKETMLPLAAVICETFAASDHPISVVRFDGTNRRGESWIDPGNRRPGDEYLGFRFSQSVRDLEATIEAVKAEPSLNPRSCILVTASLAAVEGRRAMARNQSGLLAGWISLVGMVDLHSGLRVASGGIDYAFGLSKGVSFGHQELAGVVADMDLTGKDVLESGLGLFEDARRDMASIVAPVSWIHGRYDGWIRLDQVRDLMSAGDSSNRRLVEIPSGHQLRSSREAIKVFQLVAQEASRIALGKALPPAVPRGRLLEAKQRAERIRRPREAVDLPSFWHEYLLGRSGQLGFELLASTRAYRDLMALQIKRLDLVPGDTILDLGSGVGEFALLAAEEVDDLTITAVDILDKALRRGMDRLNSSSASVRPVVADLGSGRIPLRENKFDAVLASLLVSYVGRPDRLLLEIRRVLRPGGRLVLSSPKRDADLSKIYMDGIRELSPSRVRGLFGQDAERQFVDLQRDLLNRGARLLALEEGGWFQFRDPDELSALAERAGFEVTTRELSFGDPPQVSVVTAVRK